MSSEALVAVACGGGIVFLAIAFFFAGMYAASALADMVKALEAMRHD